MIRNVAVGLSGGVDSAVTALLLKERGFQVLGVFMQNWDENDETGQCSVSDDRQDARYVCAKLGIPFFQVNFVKKYWTNVFSYFLKEYESGCTPNPDIMCNRHIKFNAFTKFCKSELKADAVATGHYARTSYGPYLEHYDPNVPVRLLEAVDNFKDQTFFLSQVNQESLQRVMFPLGNYLKANVKEIAESKQLSRISRKRESTGICFIGKRKFQEFIRDYVPSKPGPMKDISTGETLTTHDGLHLWTIGQCCHIKGYTVKYFVARKSEADSTIFVAPGTVHPALYSTILYTDHPHWISRLALNSLGFMTCRFRFQHTKPTINCRVMSFSQGLVVLLDRPLKAISPGQFAVFYKGDECLGSARIFRPGPSLFSLKRTVPLDYREYEHMTAEI